MSDRVIEIIREYTDNEVKENSDLINDLGMSSLDVVNLVVAFEDEFEIEVPDSKIKELTTVDRSVKYLEENV